jgi:hypothetical protein
MTRLAVLLTLVATFTLASSTALDAQRGGGGGGRASGGARGGGSGFQVRVNVPAAPIPPSAGMSISRPIGTGITGVQTNPPPGFGPPPPSPFAARPGTYTRLHRSAVFGVPYGYGYGYDVPTYGYSYVPESTYEKLYRTPEPAITEGTLVLDVTPVTAHVFIDSAYVGDVEDLQTRAMTLSAGRHWVDLEAPNYDRRTVEVTIRPREPLRYRFDMTPERRAETIATPPRPPQTMYMIAGCYAGNRPPVVANLPKGCDVAKVRVIPPPRTPVR